jgi:hypothetical protein
VPQLLLESAAAHRKQLQDEVVLLTNIDKQSLLKQEEQLRLLKGEWMDEWIVLYFIVLIVSICGTTTVDR